MGAYLSETCVVKTMAENPTFDTQIINIGPNTIQGFDQNGKLVVLKGNVPIARKLLVNQ